MKKLISAILIAIFALTVMATVQKYIATKHIKPKSGTELATISPIPPPTPKRIGN